MAPSCCAAQGGILELKDQLGRRNASFLQRTPNRVLATAALGPHRGD